MRSFLPVLFVGFGCLEPPVQTAKQASIEKASTNRLTDSAQDSATTAAESTESASDSPSPGSSPDAATHAPTSENHDKQGAPKKHVCVVDFVEQLARKPFGLEVTADAALARLRPHLNARGVTFSTEDYANSRDGLSVHKLEQKDAAWLLATKRVVVARLTVPEIISQVRTREGVAYDAFVRVGNDHSWPQAKLVFQQTNALVSVRVEPTGTELTFQIRYDSCYLSEVFWSDLERRE